ncbi:MAG: OmpA family protein [Bacteroidales bacterium]|nr:OmpA family protein [Bacteroidales bacterium]
MKTKTLMLVALFAMAATTASAQTENTTTKIKSADIYVSMMKETARKNWFIDVMGGGQIYFGDYDRQCTIGKRISPALSVHAGLWFTPYIGARVGYQGLSFYGATKNWAPVYGTGEPVEGDNTVQRQKFNYGSVNADFMFALSNFIFGYNPNRIYSLTAYVGAGFAWVYDQPKTNSVLGHGGFLNTFAISKRFDILVDLGVTITNDHFDGEKGGRWGEAALSLQAGLAYHFGGNRTSHFHREYSFDKATEAITRENARLNAALTSAYNEKEAALATAESATNAYNELKEKMNKMKTTSKIQTVVSSIGYASNFVTFAKGRSELTNENRLRLKMLADGIKQGGDQIKYVIAGFADKDTGTPETNARLSKERAYNVYNCLINEFGINPYLLQIEHKGGVENMYYNDPSLSRAVFILPAKQQ